MRGDWQCCFFFWLVMKSCWDGTPMIHNRDLEDRIRLHILRLVYSCGQCDPPCRRAGKTCCCTPHEAAKMVEGCSQLQKLCLSHSCGRCDPAFHPYITLSYVEEVESCSKYTYLGPDDRIRLHILHLGHSCGPCDRTFHTCSTLGPLLQQKDIRGRYVPQPETTMVA